MKKICVRCKQEKQLKDFPNHKLRKDGKDGTCKECASFKLKKWREKNKFKYLIYNKNYYQKNRENQLDYHKQYYLENKTYIKKRANNYYKKNSESIKTKVKEYRQTENGKEVKRNSSSKRRVLKNGTIETSFLIKLKENTKFCPLCNCLLSEKNGDNKYNLDHIVPINVGGTHTKDNIRFICKKCNLTRPRNGSDLI